MVKSSHNDALLLLCSLYTQPFIDLCFIVFLCCPNLGSLCTMRTEIGRRVLEETESGFVTFARQRVRATR